MAVQMTHTANKITQENSKAALDSSLRLPILAISELLLEKDMAREFFQNFQDLRR